MQNQDVTHAKGLRTSYNNECERLACVVPPNACVNRLFSTRDFGVLSQTPEPFRLLKPMSSAVLDIHGLIAGDERSRRLLGQG